MKRDFTIESYEAFCTLVNQIKDDDWCCVTDWFGDRFLDMKHWFADLGLYDYTNKMDTYYRELLDRKNTSLTEVKMVFDAVSEVDRSYADTGINHLGYCKQQIEIFRQYIANLTDIAVTGHTTVANGGNLHDVFNPTRIREIMKEVSDKLNAHLTSILFTWDSFGNIAEQYKADYIAAYELEHPEQARAMDKILSDSDFTDQEKQDIRFLAYNAPEPYRSIYIEHLKKYKVAVIQKGSKDSDGKDWSLYNSGSGKIYLYEEGTYRDWDYETFFHESGHALDDYERGSDSLSRNFEYNGQSLYDLIVDDTRDYVSDIIDQNCPNISAEQKEQLLKSLNLSGDASYEYGGSEDGLDQATKDYRQKIVNIMERDLSGKGDSSPSDVYGGVTNNAIMGNSGHFKKTNQKGSDYTYWYSKSGNPTKKQCSELWAEFFAAQMIHDEATLTSIKEHFPSAYEAMEEMARQMAAS